MPPNSSSSANSALPYEEARHLLAVLRRQVESLPESEAAPLLATLAALETVYHDPGPLTETVAQPLALPETDEAMYRSVIAQLSDGIMLTDARGLILEWNAALEHITGISHSEALGQPIWDIQYRLSPEEHRTPAHREAIAARIQDLLKTRQAPWLDQPIATEFQRPDGTHGTLQARIFLIHLQDTFLLGSVLRDITEQKRTEEALRESEERLRAIFASAQDAIFMKDRNLVYTHVNPIIEKHNRLPAEQIIGRTDRDLFGEEVAAEVATVEARVLAGEIDESEFTAVIAGNTYFLHAIRVPVRDSNGTIIGLCGFARDVTDRRRAELELQESEARYRALVNASTAGLANT